MTRRIIKQNFVSGWDWDLNVGTLTSLGTCGKPNVETFESVFALDFKIEQLESEGYEVHIAPALPIMLFRKEICYWSKQTKEEQTYLLK
jgi:hypothetical protein